MTAPTRPPNGDAALHERRPEASASPTGIVSQPAALLRARDVADWLGVSASTVLDWAEQGRLPSFKLGAAVRFDRGEIEGWLAAQRRKSA